MMEPKAHQALQPGQGYSKVIQNLITIHQQITRDLNHALTAYNEVLHNTQIAQDQLIQLLNATQDTQHPPIIVANEWPQENLEKINRVINDAANKANLLSINTAIIAEKLDSKDGVNVIAKELQTLTEQLKLAAEELANTTKSR